MNVNTVVVVLAEIWGSPEQLHNAVTRSLALIPDHVCRRKIKLQVRLIGRCHSRGRTKVIKSGKERADYRSRSAYCGINEGHIGGAAVGNSAVYSHSNRLPRDDGLHIAGWLVRKKHSTAECRLAACIERLLLFDVSGRISSDRIE